jgi:hypothetical protein
MALTIVLGPQLALKLRAVGYECKKLGGKIFYRLALGGILLGLLMTLILWEDTLSGMDIPQKVMQVGSITSVLLYLAGFVLLAWSVKRSEEVLDKRYLLLQVVALFILLPFVPIVILLAIPYGVMNYSESWLLSLAVSAWVFAASWMVTEKDSKPYTRVSIP